MSEINEFARDLVKRQIQIYNEYKSKNFDMTQPLSVLICCAIIIYSDFEEKHGGESLIKDISEKDKEGKLKNFIRNIYGSTFKKRAKKFLYKEPENEQTKEYEMFFHDLRNEFAHIIETEKSKLNPNKDGDFNRIIIKNGHTEISITKEQINELIDFISGLL